MEMILPVFAVIAGLYWAVNSFSYGMWVMDGPGGGLFPLLAGAGCVVFGIVLAVRQLRARNHLFPYQAVYPPLAVTGIIGCCYLVGMIPALTLFIILWLAGVERYRIAKSAAVGIVTGVVLYLVFVWWLYVPVPWGLLEEYLY